MNKKLEDYSEEEWEAICNNCGKCCLFKLQDEESEEIYFTDIICKYFDMKNCRCTCYAERCKMVPECLKLNKNNLDKISWIPQSCAYRALLENRPSSAVTTVKGRCVSELDVKEEDWEDHIIDWDDL